MGTSTDHTGCEQMVEQPEDMRSGNRLPFSGAAARSSLPDDEILLGKSQNYQLNNQGHFFPRREKFDGSSTGRKGRKCFWGRGHREGEEAFVKSIHRAKMVSAGSNTCNVLPRRDEMKFISLLFPTGHGCRRGRTQKEEIWEIEDLGPRDAARTSNGTDV